MNIKELAEQCWETKPYKSFNISKFAELVAAHEREECAKVCEDNADDGTEGVWDDCCHNLARKIRARGKA